MLEVLGRPQSTCAGISRRQLLQAGGAGLFGIAQEKATRVSFSVT